MSDIKPEVLELSKKLKAGITIAKDGNASVEEGLFVKNLPEGITEEQLKQIQTHTGLFIAAAGHAFGGEAIDVMKKNAELQQVSVSIPTVGKDSIDLTFQRERAVPNAGGEGTTTKYGSLSAKVNTYSAGSRGQFLKVKQDLSERAQSAFGG